MTPKEKAEELVLKYWNLPITFQYVKDGVIFVENSHINKEAAKKCALIAVDFALEFVDGDNLDEAFDKTLYLIEVKNEIDKL